MAGVAVGVTIYNRIEKLVTLLQSIDAELVSTVYIADTGGRSSRKEEVYTGSYPFDLEVFDLEYDAGLGAGRHRIGQAFDEDYLLIMDNDMRMPQNTHVLLSQLEQDTALGGVCGALVEGDRVFTSGCLDIYPKANEFILDLREEKEVTFLAGYPLVRFDMIANAALFRRECVKAYNWDPAYGIGREHADFFYGHQRLTDWEFGLCPSVLFYHDPGGSEEYHSHRWDETRYDEAESHFVEKWGFDTYDQLHDNWLETYDPKYRQYSTPGLLKQARHKYADEGARSVLRSALKLLRWRLGAIVTV